MQLIIDKDPTDAKGLLATSDAIDAVDAVAETVASAEAEGKAVYVIEPSDSKESVIAAFSEALGFPETFGGNLTALSEALADLSGLPKGQKLVVWDPGADLDRDVLTVVGEIVIDAEEQRDDLEVVVVDPGGVLSRHLEDANG